MWLAVQLTNLSIVMYFLWAALYFWISNDLAIRVFVVLFCGSLLYLLTQTVFKDSVETAENNAYRRVAKGLRNPRRVRDAVLRVSFLFMCFALSYPALVLYVTFRVHFVLLPVLAGRVDDRRAVSAGVRPAPSVRVETQGVVSETRPGRSAGNAAGRLIAAAEIQSIQADASVADHEQWILQRRHLIERVLLEHDEIRLEAGLDNSD